MRLAIPVLIFCLISTGKLNAQEQRPVKTNVSFLKKKWESTGQSF
jgi:hypothetical protein